MRFFSLFRQNHKTEYVPGSVSEPDPTPSRTLTLTSIIYPAPTRHKLWDRVEIRGPNECWPYQGTSRKLPVSEQVRGQSTLNRSVYAATRGRKPVGNVLSNCKHGMCANGAHLYDSKRKDA